MGQYKRCEWKGEGGRVEPERRLEGQQFTKQIWVENTSMTDYLQPINYDKHMEIFLEYDILL